MQQTRANCISWVWSLKQSFFFFPSKKCLLTFHRLGEPTASGWHMTELKGVPVDVQTSMPSPWGRLVLVLPSLLVNVRGGRDWEGRNGGRKNEKKEEKWEGKQERNMERGKEGGGNRIIRLHPSCMPASGMSATVPTVHVQVLTSLHTSMVASVEQGWLLALPLFFATASLFWALCLWEFASLLLLEKQSNGQVHTVLVPVRNQNCYFLKKNKDKDRSI